MNAPRYIIAAAAVLGFAVSPFAAVANPGNGNKQGQKGVKSPNSQNLVKRAKSGVVYAQGCPPGLAKKSPACVPPGQAKRNAVRVGDVVDLRRVHIVTQPGAYGLSVPPSGDRYAIVDGRLVRVDSGTGKILSILRLIDAILD